MDLNNLEGLCQDCHNKEHFVKEDGLCKAVFDKEGNIVNVKESKQVKEYKKLVKQFDARSPQ